jgi:tetratricopeptide (TPR) repeat protein
MNESDLQAAIRSADLVTAELLFKQIQTELSSSTNPSDRTALLLCKAELYGVLNKFVDARREIDLASKTAPQGDLDIRLRCEHLDALLYHAEQRVDEAFRRMTALLLKYSQQMRSPEGRPVYEDIQQRRGFQLVQLLRFEEAIPIFKECLSFDMTPEDRGEILSSLGICYSHLKRYEEARDCFLQALELGLTKQTQGEVYLQLGVAYFHLNLFQESKREFQLCEQPSTECSLPMKTLYGWLSAVCRRLGERVEAETYARLANPS